MGVPGLFRWFERRFGDAVRPRPRESRELLFNEHNCDNLYIDLNHIIHSCAHSMGLKPGDGPLFGIFEHIEAYLESLMKVAQPQKLVFIAIDGVAPRAKLNQQRTRRFLAAYRKGLFAKDGPKMKEKFEKKVKRTFSVPEFFDPNIISPGTEFMEELYELMDKYLEKQLEESELWKNLKVVFSSSSEAGEGEHKIMKFIRDQRRCPDYQPNTRHAVFGQDADLILLSLLTHEPHFLLIREDMETKSYEDFIILDIRIFRQYLKYGLNPHIVHESSSEDEEEEEGVTEDEEYKEVEKTKPKFPDFDFERTLEDFVFLTFLMGNDFLPSIPSIDVYDRFGGLDRLVMSYKAIMRGKKKPMYLTKEGTVNAAVVQEVLKLVAEDEITAYRRMANAARKAKEKTDWRPVRPPSKAGPLNIHDKQGFISLGEIPEEESLDSYLGGPPVSADDENTKKEEDDVISLSEDMSDDALVKKLKERVDKNIDKTLLKHSDIDNVQLGLHGYEGRYYRHLMKPKTGDINTYTQAMSMAYFEGLCWVFAYYTLGPSPIITNEDSPLYDAPKKSKKEKQKEQKLRYASWRWYYPYYYAPLVGDLVKYCKLASLKNVLDHGHLIGKSEVGLQVPQGPLPPFLQLLSVLPPQSADRCLPKTLCKFLKSVMPESKTKQSHKSYIERIKWMFPENIEELVDASGKKWAHTVVVKLPFADPDALCASAIKAKCESHLLENELERNVLDSGYLYVTEQTVREMKASFEGGKKDSVAGLILPDFETWDLDEDDWEEGKPIVFGFEIAGIVSQPTPCCLLEGAIEEEEALEGHTFEIPKPKPRGGEITQISEINNEKQGWISLSGHASSGRGGKGRGHKKK